LLPGIGFNLCGRDAPRAPVARILPSVLSRAVEEGGQKAGLSVIASQETRAMQQRINDI